MADLTYLKQQLEQNKTLLSTYKSQLASLQRTGADTSAVQEQITRITSTVSDLTNKVATLSAKEVSSTSSSAASDAISAIKSGSLSDSLTESLKDAGVSSEEAYKTASEYASSFTDSVSDTLTEISNSATDLASASVANMSSAAKSAASKLFGSSDNKTSAALSTAKADVGTAETDSKIKSISSDNNTAIAETVAFVTKPVTETVQSAKSAETSTTKEEVPTTGQIAAEAKKLKDEGTTDGSFSGTINAISDDLSSKIKEASTWYNETSGGITSTIGEYASTAESTIKGAIDDTLEFASPVTGTLSSAITAGQTLTKNVLDRLPGPVSKYISSAASNFVQDTTKSILGDKLSSVQNIAKLIPGVTDTSSIWSIVQGLGGKYSKVIDSLTGKDLSKSMGTANSSAADKLYAAANTICNNINKPSTYNYSQNKDLFDTLLQVATDLGLTDLVTQLSKCSNGENSYFDNRSKELLKSMTRTVAKTGNNTNYQTLVKVIGPANVSDAMTDIAVLAANTSKSDAKEDASTWSDTVEMLGYKPSSVVLSSTAVGDAYNGTTVALMSASNNTIVDSVMSSEDRSLVQAAMYQYC